jgi:hypothetical protein
VVDRPGASNVIPAHQIAGALSARFPLADAGIPDTALSAGDMLLIIGTGRWAGSATLERLRAAGRRGVKRVLWQLEPLPPPVEGLPKRILEADLRNLRDPSRSGSLLYRARRSALAKAFALSLRGSRQVDTSKGDVGRLLSYPLKQVRDVVQLWRNGLLDHIVVSVPPRKVLLAQHGIPSQVVPVGYLPELGSFLPGIERDVDVLFLGQVSARRRDLLNGIQSHLRRHCRAMRVVDGDCYGEERTLLLNRSKIIINLQKYRWEFPVIRLLMAMGCKTLVVSERATDSGPFIHDRHVIVRDAPDLGEALIRYLEQDEERSRIVDEAHSFVTEYFTLGSLLSDALTSISRASATEFSNG